jgi:hypothetical protein
MVWFSPWFDGTTFLQEYLITGPAELFAEIGGVMGLLLGWSILGGLFSTKILDYNVNF